MTPLRATNATFLQLFLTIFFAVIFHGDKKYSPCLKTFPYFPGFLGFDGLYFHQILIRVVSLIVRRACHFYFVMGGTMLSNCVSPLEIITSDRESLKSVFDEYDITDSIGNGGALLL